MPLGQSGPQGSVSLLPPVDFGQTGAQSVMIGASRPATTMMGPGVSTPVVGGYMQSQAYAGSPRMAGSQRYLGSQQVMGSQQYMSGPMQSFAVQGPPLPPVKGDPLPPIRGENLRSTVMQPQVTYMAPVQKETVVVEQPVVIDRPVEVVREVPRPVYIERAQDLADNPVKVEERIVERPREIIQWVDREVEVPGDVQVQEHIREIPQIQEIIKEVPKVITEEVIREIPKIEVQYREKYVDVPDIKTVDKVVEIPQVQEITRRIPRVQVIEIPVERIIHVTKKEVVEIPQPVHYPIPQVVNVPVEKEIPVPRAQIEQVEVVRQVAVPQIVDIEVDVPIYKAEYVGGGYEAEPEPMPVAAAPAAVTSVAMEEKKPKTVLVPVTEYVDVPVTTYNMQNVTTSQPVQQVTTVSQPQQQFVSRPIQMSQPVVQQQTFRPPTPPRPAQSIAVAPPTMPMAVSRPVQMVGPPTPPMPQSVAVAPPTMPMQQNFLTGKVKVTATIYKAAALPSKDMTGKSDAYVAASLKRGNEKGMLDYKTVVVDNNANPEWNQYFVFPFQAEPVVGTHDFVFEVFDSDKMGKDDIIGFVRIPAGDVLRGMHQQPRDYQLQPPAGQALSANCRLWLGFQCGR